MRTLNRRFFIAASVICLLSGTADARSRKKKPTPAPQFSYYLLVLSYAPDFCDQPQGNKDPRECGAGRHVGFVVHGLWPQGETSRGPENCGSSPVSQAIIQATLPYIPTESLIQHEWTAHGSCSGLSVEDYFAALRKARDSVTLPDDLNQPSQELHLSPHRSRPRSLPRTRVSPQRVSERPVTRTESCRRSESASTRTCRPAPVARAPGNVPHQA